jgi:hypothetical protein
MLNLASGGPAIQDTILEPFLYISPGRSLPLFPLHFGWWGLPLEVLILAGPPLATVAGLTLRRPYIVASNLAALSLVQHFLQRADWAYLLWVGATVAPWLLVTAVELCQDEDDHEVRPSILGAWRPLGRRAAWAVRAALRYMGTAVAAWFSLLLLFLAIFYSPLSPVSATSVVRGPSLLVQNAGHTIIAGNVREARDDRAIISYLNTHGNPPQRVFIAPRALRYAIWNITALYYVLDLQPASKYLEMNPGVETRVPVQREIIHELRDCSWVILSTAGYWYEPNASHIPGGPLLQRFIDSHYAIVYRNPSYQVLRQLSGQKVG